MTDEEWDFWHEDTLRLQLAEPGWRPVHPAIAFTLGVMVGAMFSMVVIGGLF